MTITTKETTIVLTNITNDPLVDRFIDVMGDIVVRTDEIWGDDDIDSSYEFIKPSSDSGVGVVGNNSIGAVVGAYMDKDDNLIAVCNFGDDGDLHYIVHSSTGVAWVILTTL